MAGELGEVVRNDAWITVLATSEREVMAQNSGQDASGDDIEIISSDHTSVEVADPLPVTVPAPRVPRFLSVLSALTFVAGLAALALAGLQMLDRYFPQLVNLNGVDGQPPAIFVQTDGSGNVVTQFGSRVAEQVTSWPYVMVAPLVLAGILGLLTGWLRWRVGLARVAERRARQFEAESARLTAQNAEQAMRLASMDEQISDSRLQLIDLTERLEGQTEQVSVDALVGQRLADDLEARTMEASRLSADLEDAMAERDKLETQVQYLEAALESAPAVEPEKVVVEDDGRLDGAKMIIREQRRKIDSLEQHLDQVRRRTGEMAEEIRSAHQLRAAWAQAEEVITDLSHQLSEAEKGRSSFNAQSAEAIVADNGRVVELEALLNEAADVVESLQEQLRKTRFQLSERDAAIARSDVRNQALRTEIVLLTEEIEQAAFTIASLNELPTQQRQTHTMIADLREALDAERTRTADLERQLRSVNARALRLEERLLGAYTNADAVLDLTAPVEIPAA